jgi:hypothetical protein
MGARDERAKSGTKCRNGNQIGELLGSQGRVSDYRLSLINYGPREAQGPLKSGFAKFMLFGLHVKVERTPQIRSFLQCAGHLEVS